jgi:hypothetical protein
MSYKFSHLKITVEAFRESRGELHTATIVSEYSGKECQVPRSAFSSAIQRIIYEMLERAYAELERYRLQTASTHATISTSPELTREES